MSKRKVEEENATLKTIISNLGRKSVPKTTFKIVKNNYKEPKGLQKLFNRIKNNNESILEIVILDEEKNRLQFSLSAPIFTNELFNKLHKILIIVIIFYKNVAFKYLHIL